MHLQARALRHEASIRLDDVFSYLRSVPEDVSLDDVLDFIGNVSELLDPCWNSSVVLLYCIRIPQQALNLLQLLQQVLDLPLHAPQEFGLVDQQLSYCLNCGRDGKLGHWFCTTQTMDSGTWDRE
ncbi:hypothetical protein BT93_G0598 [Corymbia citriodora subsp. variegata]|nr:hypothetical protein BT93_G0598 [Corymbia citriodora subsp. variegata]